MLIHQLRSGMWGKVEEIKDDFENCKMLMTHLKQIYLDNTYLKENELDDILKRDALFELAKISNRSNSLARLVIVLLEWSLVAIIAFNNASYPVMADPHGDQPIERSLR